MAYETLSETHIVPPYSNLVFQPNVFVNISFIENKIEAMTAYKSQLQPEGMPRSFLDKALATLRGSTIGTSAAKLLCLLGTIFIDLYSSMEEGL